MGLHPRVAEHHPSLGEPGQIGRISFPIGHPDAELPGELPKIMDLLNGLTMGNQVCLEILLQALLSMKNHGIFMPWLAMQQLHGPPITLGLADPLINNRIALSHTAPHRGRVLHG